MKKSFLIVMSLLSLLTLSSAQSIVGVWDREEQIFNSDVSVEFDADGNYIITQNGFFIILGEYRISGDTLIYHDLGGPGYCDSSLYGVALFAIAGNRLTLTVLTDYCVERNMGLNSVFINHTVDVAELPPSYPNTFALLQNYPNPFNPTTFVRYILPASAKVKVDIYNPLGQQIENLIDADQLAGEHMATWDGSNFASGVYYVRMTASDKSGSGVYRSSKKLLLIK